MDFLVRSANGFPSDCPFFRDGALSVVRLRADPRAMEEDSSVAVVNTDGDVPGDGGAQRASPAVDVASAGGAEGPGAEGGAEGPGAETDGVAPVPRGADADAQEAAHGGGGGGDAPEGLPEGGAGVGVRPTVRRC